MRPTRGVTTLLALLGLVGAANAAPGDFDPSFGSGGTTLTVIGSGDSDAADVALQTDGAIVTVGAAMVSGVNHVVVVRYDSAGVLDPAFGAGGVVSTPVGDFSRANAVALQSDGKIVVGGLTATAGASSFLLLRYDDSGALDPGFGAAGIATLPIVTALGVEDLVLQSDERIVVVGTQTGSDSRIALARYDTGGTLDPTFGTGGVTTTLVGTSSQGNGITRLAGDGLAVAGTSENRFLVARYDASGILVPSFGSGGTVTTVVTPGYDYLRAITSQSDGKLLVTGATALAGAAALTVARYTTAGALDPTFGSGGIAYEDFGLFSEGTDLQVLPDGKILAAGTAGNPSGPPAQTATNFVTVRLDADGNHDPSFVFAGDGPSPESFLSAVVLQPDGWMVAVGSGGFSFLSFEHFDLLVGRYDASTCGNGITEGPEQCDDGDAESGDGCDANCTVTACGNGIVTSGEDCDGGDCCTPACAFAASGTPCTADTNACTDDQCAAAGVCAHPANSAPCDDGSVCTANDVCSGGTCGGTPVVSCPPCQACEYFSGACVEAPRPQCRGTLRQLKSALDVTVSTTPERQSLRWRYRYGVATSVDDFGEPTSTDAYDVCLFQHYQPFAPNDLVWQASIPAGGVCNGTACWKAGARGPIYHDRTRAADGIDRLTLRASDDGRTKIDLKAKGGNLAAPNVSYTSRPLLLQLQRSDGPCWETTFDEGGAIPNGAQTQKQKFRGD
jgi:uncharacterized delta-60 repeat protein